MGYKSDGARTAPVSPSIAMPLGNSVQGKVTGVTRIGARAGMIVAGVLAAIVLAMVYGISASGNHRAAAPVAIEPQILPTTGPVFENIPGANATPQPAPTPRTVRRQPAPAVRQVAQSAPALPDPATQPALQRTAVVPDIHAIPQAPANLQLPAAPVAAPVDVAKALKLERERQALQIAQAAQHAGIIITTPANPAAANIAAASAARSAPIAMETDAPAAAAQASSDPNADPTVASQQAKNEFLKLQKSTTANDYSLSPRQAAISPYEVQAGAVIPGILITGINSDLPGQMVGQVSQDVYDSKTGNYLLIPAGSKLVGRYDSQVTNGQSRVLVAWQRIIFPDSSFIDINGLTGSDTAGYSGFTGKVDDHSGKLFRNAILFSLIGAGATLLQPRTAIAALTPAGMVVAPSVGSQVAGQVGTQLAQTAQQTTQQGLRQQPTIEVRPGYLFNIMVDHDLVLPGPYTK